MVIKKHPPCFREASRNELLIINIKMESIMNDSYVAPVYDMSYKKNET
jgi:hypothetical protein